MAQVGEALRTELAPLPLAMQRTFSSKHARPGLLQATANPLRNLKFKKSTAHSTGRKSSQGAISICLASKLAATVH